MSKSQYETYEAYGPGAAPPGAPGGTLPGRYAAEPAAHARAGEPVLPRQGAGGPPGEEAREHRDHGPAAPRTEHAGLRADDGGGEPDGRTDRKSVV